MGLDNLPHRAEAYAKGCPSYPKEAIDKIIKLASSKTVFADIGAGTGKLTAEIAFWNKGTLGKMKIINTPLKLSGRAHIEKDFMYISSRNILGIDRISLIE